MKKSSSFRSVYKVIFRFHGNRFKQMHFEGVFCTDMRSDGSFVPVVPPKSILFSVSKLVRPGCIARCYFALRLHVNLSHNAMPKGGKIGQNHNSRESKNERKCPWNWQETLLLKSRLSVKMMLWVNRFHRLLLRLLWEKIINWFWIHRKLSDESIDPKGEIREVYRLVSMDSSKNLQEGFIQIRNVVPVRSSFSVIFTFAILIVYIIKCASVVAVLVRRRHHLVIFFIFVVVGHLELREISTSRFGLSSGIYMLFVMAVVWRNLWVLVNIIP